MHDTVHINVYSGTDMRDFFAIVFHDTCKVADKVINKKARMLMIGILN